MVGGRADGLVILDLDAYKPGHADDLAGLGELPPTREFRTPGRNGTPGRHLVYRDPDGRCHSGVLGKNKTIDIRAGASSDYIIMPGSVNADGRPYVALDWRPPALAPAWLQTAGRSREAVQTVSPGAGGLVVPIHPPVSEMSDDEKNEWTYRIFRNGLRQQLTPDQIIAEAEADEITLSRRSEQKRQQPGWWPDEIERCLDKARREVWYGEGTSKPTIKQVLMQIARRDFDIGQTRERMPYAVPRTGPRVARIFRGSKDGLRASLAMRFEQQTGHAPGNGSLADVMTVLEGISETKPEVTVPMRTAWHEGRLVLDLGRRDGRTVVISPGSWEVTDASPVMFLRTDLTGELPEPQRGGRLVDTLLPLLNLHQADRALAVAVAHPVMYLQGEEGTAKSTAARLLRSLVDPSPVEVRRQPGKDEDWEVTIAGQWGVVLDNLSTLPDWLSDAICTAVTGTGDIKRRMYSNQELSVIWLRRCFILTSIDTLVSRGDLVDRSVIFELYPISERRMEQDIWRTWEQAQPRALGALLDVAAGVLAVLREQTPPSRFRMADFASIVAAMDRVTGSHALDCYGDKIAEGIRSSVESDLFAAHILRLAESGWEGTSHDLFDTYRVRLGRIGSADQWPKNPVAMGMRLRRIAGILRKSGVVVGYKKGRISRVWQFYRDGA